MEITVEVPDVIADQVLRFRDRLPEALERGLREIAFEDAAVFDDERAIMQVLASQPAPEQILALRASPELQARVSELLFQNKERGLSQQEQSELERHLYLEHLVRLAKAHAYKQRG